MEGFKRVLALTLVAAATLLALGCSANNSSGQNSTVSAVPTQTYTLKLSHEMAEGTPEAVAAEQFAASVGEKTNGAVTIEVFPHGQLGDPATAIESAKLGNIDIVCVASGNFARLDPIFNIDTIPYLYADSKAFTQVLRESGALDSQMDILHENGFVLLNEGRNYFRGPYRVLCSTKPINSVEDFKELRLRAFENTNYMTAYEKLGAHPIVLPWSDVFMSLQQGVIEAAACASGSLQKEGFTQVAPYVAVVNEYVSSILIVGTSKTFDTMPAEYMTAIQECANQWGSDVDVLIEQELDGQIKEMEAAGATFTDINTSSARETLKDFYYSLEQNGSLPTGSVDVALAYKN